MGEFEEFAEALLDQISVEINEEREITKLSERINADSDFPVQFTPVSYTHLTLPTTPYV